MALPQNQVKSFSEVRCLCGNTVIKPCRVPVWLHVQLCTMHGRIVTPRPSTPLHHIFSLTAFAIRPRNHYRTSYRYHIGVWRGAVMRALIHDLLFALLVTVRPACVRACVVCASQLNREIARNDEEFELFERLDKELEWPTPSYDHKQVTTFVTPYCILFIIMG